MAPCYDLQSVKEAAQAKRIELGESRARQMLVHQVETLEAAYRFAAAVLMELELEHFSKTVKLEKPHAGQYDVYGITVSPSVQTAFGVASADWCLKLRLKEDFEGQTVFLLSLHEPERPLKVVRPPHTGSTP